METVMWSVHYMILLYFDIQVLLQTVNKYHIDFNLRIIHAQQISF